MNGFLNCACYVSSKGRAAVYDEFGKMLKEAAVMYLYFMQLLGV
jgi:hypothetical protein